MATVSKAQLYIDEWMIYRQMEPGTLAKRMNVEEPTIWRWRNRERRPSNTNLGKLASIFDCGVEDLWRPPGRRSIDSIAKDLNEGAYKALVMMAEQMAKGEK